MSHAKFLLFLLRCPLYFFFISDPDFVSSLEDEDHVYFFFRESAVEYINCGKVNGHCFFLNLSYSLSFQLIVQVLSTLLLLGFDS